MRYSYFFVSVLHINKLSTEWIQEQRSNTFTWKVMEPRFEPKQTDSGPHLLNC